MDQKEAILKENWTFIRRFVIEHAIDKAVTKSILPIQTKLSQKLELIISERNNKNHIEANSNAIITNLSSITLTNDEYETLQFGLNHGLAKQSRDVDTFVIAEDLWDQLYRNNILKDNHFSIERTKNILRCFAFNIINIDDKRIFKDAKRIKLIKKLRQDVAILKPDKGNGIVLIDIPYYTNCVSRLFDNKDKFRQLKNNPTLSRLKSLQRYLNQLLKRNEIDEQTYKSIRPKNAKPARAHGLPKIHKTYDKLPPF